MNKIALFLGFFCAFSLGLLSCGDSNVSVSKDIEGVVWEKVFGGDRDDIGRFVQQTSDGGYIIAGSTYSYGAGDSDIWLVKTDSDGNELWNKTFGGEESDTGYCVQQTSDGGCIVAGVTGYSFGIGVAGSGSYVEGGGDIWLIKADSDGNELWNKTFGGEESDTGYCVQQTSDGGYIIAGNTDSYGAGNWDIWLIKTDSDGNELWNKTFGGEESDTGYCVQQTSDGGYIIAGNTDSYGAGNWDIWLIKTDSDGNELWNKTFGGEESDTGYCVQQTSDGGYIVAGEIGCEEDYTDDVLLTKLSSSGAISWQLKFGGPSFDAGLSVIQTTDGSYVITGYTGEIISGLAQFSCANLDREYYFSLFLIKITHDN